MFDHALENPFVLRTVPKAAGAVFDGLDHAVENRLITKEVPKAAGAVFDGLDHAVENKLVMRDIPKVGYGIFSVLNSFTDTLVLFLRKTLFRRNVPGRLYRKHSAYYTFAYIAGHVLDAFAFLLNITFYREHPIDVDFTYVLAARVYDKDTEFGRITRSVSFALLLFAAGLLAVLFYLLILH